MKTNEWNELNLNIALNSISNREQFKNFVFNCDREGKKIAENDTDEKQERK